MRGDAKSTRLRKDLLRFKKDALVYLGRREGVKAVDEEISMVPPRNPDSSSRQIDLTEYYTESFFRAKRRRPR